LLATRRFDWLGAYRFRALSGGEQFWMAWRGRRGPFS